MENTKDMRSAILLGLLLVVLITAADTPVTADYNDHCSYSGINVHLTNWTGSESPSLNVGESMSVQITVDPVCHVKFRFPVTYYFVDSTGSHYTVGTQFHALKDVLPTDVITEAGTYHLCATAAHPDAVAGCSEAVEFTTPFSIVDLIIAVFVVILVIPVVLLGMLAFGIFVIAIVIFFILTTVTASAVGVGVHTQRRRRFRRVVDDDFNPQPGYRPYNPGYDPGYQPQPGYNPGYQPQPGSGFQPYPPQYGGAGNGPPPPQDPNGGYGYMQ